MAVGQVKRISLAYTDPFLVHALVPILINCNHCYYCNTVLYCNCQFSFMRCFVFYIHVDRHASCRVIRLCHKNLINSIMAVSQIKRMISLAYADPFIVHVLVPILINCNYCYHGNTVLYCNHVFSFMFHLSLSLPS